MRQRLLEMSILPLERFLGYVDDLVIGRAPGLGVWLTKVEHGASPMLIRHLQHNRVFHERVLLLGYAFERRPRVPFAERLQSRECRTRLLSRPGAARIYATADIPALLKNFPHCSASIAISNTSTITWRTRRLSGATRVPPWGRIPFAIFSFSARLRAVLEISRYRTMG